MSLSPMTISGLAAHWDLASATPPSEESTKEKHIEEITLYVCPVCEEEHECRSDAVNCCDEEDEAEEAVRKAATTCPVCANEYSDSRAAADCCLWKDLDAPTRWKMADEVAAGSTWAQVLKLRDPSTGLNS